MGTVIGGCMDVSRFAALEKSFILVHGQQIINSKKSQNSRKKLTKLLLLQSLSFIRLSPCCLRPFFLFLLKCLQTPISSAYGHHILLDRPKTRWIRPSGVVSLAVRSWQQTGQRRFPSIAISCKHEKNAHESRGSACMHIDKKMEQYMKLVHNHKDDKAI